MPPCLSAAQTCSSSPKACPAEIASKHTKLRRSVAIGLFKTASMGWGASVQLNDTMISRNWFSLRRAIECRLLAPFGPAPPS
jgi:hypothetical protein